MFIIIGGVLIIIGGALTQSAIKRNGSIVLDLYQKNLIDRRTYEDSLIKSKAVPRLYSFVGLAGWVFVAIGLVSIFL